MNNVTSGIDSTSVYTDTKTAQDNAVRKTNVTGRTIGTPKLSEKAAKYYEQLKKKYSNMDFILVSEDEKENAKANAGKYANSGSMVVLIDEAKIEKMAEDEDYRKQYEGVIRNAATGLSGLSKGLGTTGAKVSAYGMQVNDNGTATFFAVLKKSSAEQKARIEKKAEQKKATQKEEARKAEKKKAKEKLDEKLYGDDDDYITVTASSMEELIEKVRDANQMIMSDNVMTEEEKNIGQKIDFSV